MHNITVGVDIFVLGYLEIISLVHFITCFNEVGTQ